MNKKFRTTLEAYYILCIKEFLRKYLLIVADFDWSYFGQLGTICPNPSYCPSKRY